MTLAWGYLLALCVTTPASAAVLKGIVIENEFGGRPVPSVQASAPGANPTRTGSDGQFTLDFPQMKPGDSVRVVVNKPGYVVVNEVQLELALPSNPSAKLLVILICTKASRDC